MRLVQVQVAGGSYPVVVGHGALAELPHLLPADCLKAAIVTQATVGVGVGTGRDQHIFQIGEGEEAKSLSSVQDLCRGFARWGLSRADVVVAVGGGVVTDVAGFAAAVYHRGVPVVHVATTLLGQVDAAIGGKTGVNLPEGKNLVGAFWQPSAVVCDTAVLATLPPREYRSGLGEMAKYAFLGVDGLASMPLEEAVAACVQCKASFVAGDERESEGLERAGGGVAVGGHGGPGAGRGGRALLNYGHTLAHALETIGRYDLRHGEAVAIGLVFAARLARRLGRVGDERVAEHEQVVAGYDLPTRLPPQVGATQLVEAMAKDKKATGGGLTFVLDGPDGLEVVRGVGADVVAEVLAQMQAT